MAKKQRLSGNFVDSAFDVVEAIKRALLRRGLIRQKPKTKTPRSLTAKLRRKKLVTAAIKAHDILFKANTVFPFTLFPDTVTLDREKLTIATRYFFGVSKITSIPIRDLLNVEADTGPFFGSVHTASRFFNTVPFSIKWLSRNDAVKLQRLLEGYIIANEQDIDCDSLDTGRLCALLEDLGKGDTG